MWKDYSSDLLSNYKRLQSAVHFKVLSEVKTNDKCYYNGLQKANNKILTSTGEIQLFNEKTYK